VRQITAKWSFAKEAVNMAGLAQFSRAFVQVVQLVQLVTMVAE